MINAYSTFDDLIKDNQQEEKYKNYHPDWMDYEAKDPSYWDDDDSYSAYYDPRVDND